MKKVLMILFIFLGIFIYQDTTERDKSSQKSLVTNVVIDNQNPTPNDIATSSHSPFYFASYNLRIVVKILAVFFIVVGFAFIFILIKAVKELIS
jgi:hypothetical protein